MRYAAQLEALGHWQWAIYVLLHINFDSHKTLNGEWGFASGRQEAVSSILERHAPSISEKYPYFRFHLSTSLASLNHLKSKRHYQFLTQELRVPASWVDAAVGRYLIYERQYQVERERVAALFCLCVLIFSLFSFVCFVTGWGTTTVARGRMERST